MATERRRDQTLARRAASVSGVAAPRQKAVGRKLVTAVPRPPDPHYRATIERELAELDEECARFRRLLQRLGAARRAKKDTGAILGELGTSVLHLHVHTKGLDELIDDIE